MGSRRARRRPPPCVASLAVGLLVLAAAPARGDDLLDIVIQAVDPDLAPARPLIECLAGGGNATGCAEEATRTQASGRLPIGPEDDRVKKAVAVFEAAREERWFDVFRVGGEVVAKTVSCAMLPLQGPAKPPACAVIGWVLSKNAGVVDKAYQALKGPDWWALVDLLGTGVCEFIPGDGAAGAAKDVLCGALAEALLEAKKMADAVASAATTGADALENLVFGDDSHMPYDRYYALYWQPWYHYATLQVYEKKGIGSLLERIWNPCVDYFDSHNQYRSTARKTCDDMRDKRFSPQVRGFARAVPPAIDGYFETIARPAVRAAVLASWGQPSSKDLPGQKLFEQNCAFQMRARFPFPEPDVERCTLLTRQSAGVAQGLRGLFLRLAQQCFEDVAQQKPRPTLWESACESVGPRYKEAFAEESLALLASLARLKGKGCVSGARSEGVRGPVLTCDSHIGYSACLTEFGKGGKQHCRVHVRTVSAAAPRSARAATARPAGAASPGALLAVVSLEAEALLDGQRLRAKGGRLERRASSGRSGGAAVSWMGARQGSTLDLLVDVPRDGRWSISVDLTRGPDHGLVQATVNGVEGARFDGYAARASGPVEVSLGSFNLEAGRRIVRLTLVSRSRASTGYAVDIDRVRLRPSGSP